MVRVYTLNAFHIVTYGLGIYLLNLFIGFLSPQVCIDHHFVRVCSWLNHPAH